MLAIGGIWNSEKERFYFWYDVGIVIAHMQISGCLPDEKSHQFYPTPDTIGDDAAKWLKIKDGGAYLEPSAGQGNLAKRLPEKSTTCVEINKLYCSILQSTLLQARIVNADFLKWAKTTKQRFDGIIMNPPFSEGRAAQHTETAANLLKPDGALVAVLPASYRQKFAIDGYDISWSRTYDRQFPGTSISVVLARITRCKP